MTPPLSPPSLSPPSLSPPSLSAAELAAVARILADHGIPTAGPLTATLVTGGRSNLTFKITDLTAAWALRLPPRAGRTPSAHDVARELRVIAALHGTGVPVPPPVAAGDDPALGGAFAITEWVDGHTVQSRDDLDRLSDAEVAAVVAELLTALAALHRVDHQAIGLAGLARPGSYAERQLRRWSAQWDLISQPTPATPAAAVTPAAQVAAATPAAQVAAVTPAAQVAAATPADVAALADATRQALRARLPEQRSTALLHGDFRIDNALLDLGDEPEIAAIVDWELAAVGDPVADVAMMCAYRDRAFDLVVGRPAAWTSDRVPSAAALAEGYERAGGVELVDWSFQLALAYFKIGVIAAGIDHRYRAGAATGPGFATAGASVQRYFELALATI